MQPKNNVGVARKVPLVLRPVDLRQNLLKLLGHVQRDQRVMESFINNPTKAIATQVVKRSFGQQQVSETNRLLFALIANTKMRAWLSEYEPSGRGARAEKQEFANAFAKQVASLNDQNIVAALIGNAMAENGIPGLTNVAYQCVCNETTGKTSTVCTPVSKNQLALIGTSITPDTIRALTEALVARAQTLAREGTLANLQQRVG